MAWYEINIKHSESTHKHFIILQGSKHSIKVTNALSLNSYSVH